jgi:DNA-binding XRE family transcriptional regulator
VLIIRTVKLPEYIKKVGAKALAKRIGVRERTVLSWQYLDRRPRPETAQKIVERTPVTMEGIYGQ